MNQNEHAERIRKFAEAMELCRRGRLPGAAADALGLAAEARASLVDWYFGQWLAA